MVLSVPAFSSLDRYARITRAEHCILCLDASNFRARDYSCSNNPDDCCDGTGTVSRILAGMPFTRHLRSCSSHSSLLLFYSLPMPLTPVLLSNRRSCAEIKKEDSRALIGAIGVGLDSLICLSASSSLSLPARLPLDPIPFEPLFAHRADVPVLTLHCSRQFRDPFRFLESIVLFLSDAHCSPSGFTAIGLSCSLSDDSRALASHLGSRCGFSFAE
jgi:hypothetical protein